MVAVNHIPPDWLVQGDCRTADEYLAHVRYYDRHGLNPRPPETVAEIEAMLIHHPDHKLTPRLTPDQLREFGLSPFLRSGVPNLDQEWQERFLATLATDIEFRSAVHSVLIGGAE